MHTCAHTYTIVVDPYRYDLLDNSRIEFFDDERANLSLLLAQHTHTERNNGDLTVIRDGMSVYICRLVTQSVCIRAELSKGEGGE